MAKPSVDDLLVVESRLNRSLVACVIGFAAILGWSFVASRAQIPDSTYGSVALALLILQAAAYVWYAVSAGAAARILGDRPWKYVVWILVAPFVAQLLPIPILSMLIAASPLSIKFLLGGQLNAAIRERPFVD